MKLTKLAKKGRWSRRDAEFIVAAWRRSGRTQTSFAAELGCSMKRLSMWKNRLDAAALVHAPVAFVEVKALKPSSMVVEVAGCTIRVEPGFDAQLLRSVVGALEVA